MTWLDASMVSGVIDSLTDVLGIIVPACMPVFGIILGVNLIPRVFRSFV